MQIKKLSYNGSRMHIEYSVLNSVTESDDSYIFESGEPPLESFTTALQNLKSHVVWLCEFSPEYGDVLVVRGITLGWTRDRDDISSVNISALRRVNSTYAPFNIHAPQVLFLERDKSPSIQAVYDDVHALLAETARYIAGERAQLELKFDGATAEAA